MKCTGSQLAFTKLTTRKNAFQSILDDVPGIGEKRKKQLLKHFGSVKKMKEATIERLSEAGIQKQTAELLMEL
ncbi:helix-hairpin-helix domain-containing protein [Bacillus sp. SL00103]